MNVDNFIKKANELLTVLSSDYSDIVCLTETLLKHTANQWVWTSARRLWLFLKYWRKYEKVFESKKLLYQWKKSWESIVAEMFFVLVDPQTAVLKLISFLSDQKQFSSGVLMKRCSENVQQIYKRTPMSNCDFNKTAGKIIEIKFRHGYL